MKKIIFALFAQLTMVNYLNAQVFDVDTLQYKGDANKYINLVIMGDGYTNAELGKFMSDASNLSTYLFTQAPWSNYRNYFNVFAIKVISNQSGTKHPNNAGDCSTDPFAASNPDNYFGSTFDAYGIHRLVVPMNTAKLSGVLSGNFPNYDQVFVIANSTYYGGSGGSYATSTTNVSANEIATHEIGHSFAGLADEYYAGDIYSSEKPNMTKQTDPAQVKWKNWMNFNGTGIFQHCCGGNSSQWYKPHANCKMQSLGSAFCSVCSETIIEKIHSLVNPIVSYSPTSSTITSTKDFIDFKLTEVMKPVSNTLKTIWTLDGTTFSTNPDSAKIDQKVLASGSHTLTASVTDTTSLLRVDNHKTKHVSIVTWTIIKTITGIELAAKDNKILYSIYPNPSPDLLNISIELEKNYSMKIDIVSVDGKVVRNLINSKLDNGIYSHSFDLRDMAKGIYMVVFNTGGFIHTETFIKE